MEPRILAERIVRPVEKFKSSEEELAYLRERVREKEKELDTPKNQFESDRIAKREIAEYSSTPASAVLHEDVVMPEHETLRHVLKLEPEEHDTHLEDDLHRVLVRYIAEGLPEKGFPPPEKVKRALHMVLFEIQPQAHGEKDKEQGQKLEQILASSEQLYAGLMSLIGKDEGFSLEIAVGEGTEEASLYLAVPRAKQTLAERLISSVFPNARISECRGDYNIFNYKGESAGAVARLDEHPAFPLKTYETFEHDPLNVLLASFAKLAKHGEGAAVQFIVGTEGDRYNKHYKKMLRAIEKGRPLSKDLRVPETIIGEVIYDVSKAVFMPRKYKEDKEREFRRASDQVATEAIGRKVKS